MNKQSPEQYLKYLTALSLAMTASAGAQSTSAAPAEESFKASGPSVNLEGLVEAVSSEGQEQAAGYVAGCMGWPESTYVRRIIIKVPTVTSDAEHPAAAEASLESTIEDVLGDLA